MNHLVTVAIPTLDGGSRFHEVLRALQTQRIDCEIELLVCDSGSTDGTPAVARRHGARVIDIARASFSHGGTRNLLMSESRGRHVAFLTQDAVPAGDRWLARLLSAFSVGDDVGLAVGPYVPRPDASLTVARELTTWFASFQDETAEVEGLRIDRLADGDRSLAADRFFGHLGFFTDANGIVARDAWEKVPFRTVQYAEDHWLAIDMLRAGYGKAFVADAAVVHSHDYSLAQWLRRSFDETRAVNEVYGVAPGERLHDAARNIRGGVGADLRFARRTEEDSARPIAVARLLGASSMHHAARAVGRILGARADRLPAPMRGALSLEGRR